MSESRVRAARFATQVGAYSQTFVDNEAHVHSRYELEVFSRVRHHRETPLIDLVHTVDARQAAALYATTTHRRESTHRMKRGTFDLIRGHKGLGSMDSSSNRAATKPPLIVNYHGGDARRLLTHQRCRTSDGRYCHASKAMPRNVKRFSPRATPERIRVSPLGVNIPECKATPMRTRRNIASVSRPTEGKGHLYGFDAFGKLNSQRVDVTLHIVGEGDLGSKYNANIPQHHRAGRDQCDAIPSQPNVLNLMEGLDVLMCPSMMAANEDREPGILVSKEAGTRDVPVIGRHHGNIPEIIDGQQTRSLESERHNEALADRLYRFTTKVRLRSIVGRAAPKKFVHAYDIKQRIAVVEDHEDEVRRSTHGTAGAS